MDPHDLTLAELSGDWRSSIRKRLEEADSPLVRGASRGIAERLTRCWATVRGDWSSERTLGLDWGGLEEYDPNLSEEIAFERFARTRHRLLLTKILDLVPDLVRPVLAVVNDFGGDPSPAWSPSASTKFRTGSEGEDVVHLADVDDLSMSDVAEVFDFCTDASSRVVGVVADGEAGEADIASMLTRSRVLILETYDGEGYWIARRD